MFDLLKKKIRGFVDKLKGKVEEKAEREIEKKREEIVVVEEKPVRKKVKVTKEKKKKEKKIKIGLGKKLVAIFKKKIKLSEKEIEDYLWELELSLLEADVDEKTTKEIIKKLEEKILTKEFVVGEEEREIFNIVKSVLKGILVEGDFLKKIEEKKQKPFVVLFLGNNGYGKTTTIAKLAYLLKKKGKTVMFSSSDTFRAAAIEQLQEHADKLGVKTIKHDYGADPAAVSFDARKSAEARKTDVLLIDTAGRQETNRNLIEELKKIDRVVKPDMKVFVIEAFTGKSALEKARGFYENVGLDAVILTKADLDVKGGSILSITHNLKKPVLFLGTGQKYEDLEIFDKERFVDNLLT